MATFTVEWAPTNGGSYEIWYGKLSVVGTTVLPSSSGFTQVTGSPFDSSLGVAVISGLDDNTQYRILSRADCTNLDSIWIDESGYKLICPTLSVIANPLVSGIASITATVTPVNLIEFEAVATTISLVLKNTVTSAIVETKVFTTPYTSPISYIFNNLLVNTQYTCYLSIHDNVATQDITCSNQSATTPIPVVVPPPVCDPPTFTLSNINISSVQINITSTIITGDTFDISVNGGTSYPFTGYTTTPIILSTGLSPATQYTVVLKRHCQLGGVSTSTSQTFTTDPQIIQGTVAFSALSSSSTSPITATFTFPQPTAFPIQVNLGYIEQYGCGANNCLCNQSMGYEIFTIPSGGQNCTAFPNGPVFYGPLGKPFVINIPAGVTTYANTRVLTQSQQDANNGYSPWQYTPASGRFNHAKGITDVYIKVVLPAGYSASFNKANGANIDNIVVLHNV